MGVKIGLTQSLSCIILITVKVTETPIKWHPDWDEGVCDGEPAGGRVVLHFQVGSATRKEPTEQMRKNREMKEGPTILLIIKDRYWKPTMSMKTNKLTYKCRDVYENK